MNDLGDVNIKVLIDSRRKTKKLPFNVTRTLVQQLCTCCFIAVALIVLLFLPVQYESLFDNKTSTSTLTAAARNDALQPEQADKVISCYYNTPAHGASDQLLPSHLRPHLCTHINVAFATIRNCQIHLDSHQYESLKDVVKLKTLNPKLKVLVSIGGAGNNSGYPEMIKTHASRKVFIKSIKTLLRNYSLDGIDLDWEFPALQQQFKNITQKRERQHFSQLLREIKAEYAREKRDYWLTVAAAAQQTIVDVSYDVDQLNLYADYVNIMTYDFHIFSRATPFTGLNSPLYARQSEHLYMSTLNINHTVHMYRDKGLDPNKIVIGIPTYGHSYTLFNVLNNKIGSPARGYGSLGSLGFASYSDICQFLKQFESQVQVKEEPDAKVPYLYRYTEWVSFDTPQSVMKKADYIRDNKLRGAMIYSLNADDYSGVCNHNVCGDDKFPLSQSIKNALDHSSC